MHNSIEFTELTSILSAMFGNREGWVAFWEGKRPVGSKDIQPVKTRFIANRDVEESSLRKLLRQVAVDDELYVAPLLYGTKQRRKTEALPLSALYVDGDGATIPEGFPKPNITLETSPGRHHYVWLLSEVVR